MRFALNKRALMLSAAAVALLSGNAFAQTTISSKQTSPVSTSSDGTITIGTDGSVVITTNPAVSPAVTINGGPGGVAANVINQGTISYVGVGSSSSPVTGVELLGGSTGGLDNVDTIDLTGSGTNKTGILVAPGTGPFIGNINNLSDGTALDTEANLTVFGSANPAAVLLESGSTLKVQGDNSYGVNIASGATLGSSSQLSDIDIFGAITMTPSSSSSTASTSTAINIAGTMFGNINLVSGGNISVQGNSTSTGITIVSGTTGGTSGGVLNGNINVGGLLALTPVTATDTTGNNIGIDVGGTMNGNILIGNSGTISATGPAAQGILVTGAFNGYIENEGSIETVGTSSPSTTSTNPVAGPALGIGSNIPGGIGNIAQVGSSLNTTISTIGGGTNYTIRIDPSLANTTSPAPLWVGEFMGDADATGNHFALFNTGTIRGTTGDNFNTNETTVYITGGGTTSAVTTLQGGIYNSGTIESTTTTTSKVTTGATATALDVGPYTQFTNYLSGNTILAGIENAPGGSITASVTGAEQGTATAVQIGQTGNQFDIGIPAINNAGTISANVSTTTLTISNPTTGTPVFAAYGIYDASGSLTTINNSGTIETTATKLNDNSQVTEAVNVAANTTGVTFTNSGTVIGDVVFGGGADKLNVTGGSAGAPAVVDGSINFGGTANCVPATNCKTGPDDTLFVGSYGTVNGNVQEPNGSKVDITVANAGTFNLLAPPVIGSTTLAPPVGTPLSAGTLTVDNGGTLGISVSQGYNVLAYPNAQNLAIIDAATAVHLNGTVSIDFGGFVSTPGGKSSEFALIATPSGKFNAGAGDLTPLNELGTISRGVQENMPYLFTGSLCTWNLGAGLSACSGANPVPGDSVLGLTLNPKTVGSDGCTSALDAATGDCNTSHIPLSGNAARIYPYANAALGTDNALGSAMISAIKNSADAESAYGSFVPDVTGATRAVAISLTDDASDVVAARQRELRQYANQEGDLTLWGQEFAQRLEQKDTAPGIPGYRDSGFGFALGADEGGPEDGRYGGAFQFFNGGERENAPGSSKTTSEWYMLTGYTDWRGKGLFLDTQATVGYVNLKGNRYLNLEVPSTTTTGTLLPYGRDAYEQHPGEYLAGSAMTGAIFNEDATVITPELSLDGLVMREEPYTEAGGGNGFDLHVASSYAQSLRAFTGVDVRQDIDLTDFLLQPEIRAGYRYDFANGIQSLKANFASVSPQSVFDVSGPRPDKGNIVAGGGLAVTTGAWSLGLGLDYLRAGSGNTAEEGTITLLARI